MGCSGSKPPAPEEEPRLYDEEDQTVHDPFTRMSPKQMALVHTSMKKLAAKDEIKNNGAEFFMKLFQVHPDYQDYFQMLKGKTGHQVHLSSQIRVIGARVFQFLLKCTESMERTPELRIMIAKIAETHYHRYVNVRHFQAAHAVFMEYIAAYFGEQFTPDLQEAWDLFWKFMIVAIVDKHETLDMNKQMEQASNVTFAPPPTPNPRKSVMEKYFSK